MKKLLMTTCVVLAMAGTAHAAEPLPDYSDKDTWSCSGKDKIEYAMTTLISTSAAGIQDGVRLLYIKGDPVELSRNRDELRCRIVAVTNRMIVKGVFIYRNQDGHALTGFNPLTVEKMK